MVVFLGNFIYPMTLGINFVHVNMMIIYCDYHYDCYWD